MSTGIFKRVNDAIDNIRTLNPQELSWLVTDLEAMHETWDGKPAPESVGDYFSNIDILFRKVNIVRPDLRPLIPPQHRVKRGIEELDRLDELEARIYEIGVEDVRYILQKRGSIETQERACGSAHPMIPIYLQESASLCQRILEARPDIASNADIYWAIRRA